MKIFKTFLLTITFLISFIFILSFKNEYKVLTNDDYIYYQNVLYGDYGIRNKMDIMIPSNKEDNCGMLFLIHGGGWIAGSKDDYYNTMVDYTKKGYVCVAVNYRYAGMTDYNGILDDLNNAVILSKHICEKEHKNISGMMLMGGSAGAHLSLLYGYKYHDISPIKTKAVVSLAGPTDLMDKNYYSFKLHEALENLIGSLINEDIDNTNYMDYQSLLLDASPISYLDKAIPTIIAHGALDEVVPVSNAYTLNELLDQINVKHDLIIFPNSNHGLESDKDIEERTRLYSLIDEYLELYVK